MADGRLKPFSVGKFVINGCNHQKGGEHYTIFYKKFGPMYAGKQTSGTQIMRIPCISHNLVVRKLCVYISFTYLV
jgi:hypothetical protein